MRPSSNTARAAVMAYISSVSNKQFDTLPSLFSPDASWWVAGNPERVPKGGQSTAAAHLPALPNLINNFDDYEYKLVNMVAERSSVMVETQAIGNTNDGIHYVNNITVAFEVGRDGLITSVREYPVYSEIAWLLEQLAARTGNATQSV